MDYIVFLVLISQTIGTSIAARAQTLSCFSCVARPGNNTCTNGMRGKVKSLGFDKRCRIMEMDGKVVSAGIVPDKLCTPEALSKVNKVKNQLHLTGAGNIYPYCCDFDLCNSDMCTAMNLPAGNSKCVTTITNKQEQAVLLQQGVIKNEVENTKPQQDAELKMAKENVEKICTGNSNNNNEVTEKALASLQSAGLGGSLTKNACLAPKPILFSIYLGCTLIWLFQ